ncbi:MAG TPA: hypothetical protein DDY78_03595 [Planctomycetales bacterium]|jgi:endogenous inhibitor of DNA gyrase (YacG/DUF329 family)|nr:hypothetical protein [Planctomycetales bacterium]
MTISVTCPTCGTKLRAPGASVGKRLKCPKCGEIVALPATSAPAANFPAAAPTLKVSELKGLPKPGFRWLYVVL